MTADAMIQEVSSAHSVQQAVDDAPLVDLMPGDGATMIRLLGLPFNIAMTAAAYDRAVQPSHGSLPHGQHGRGRLWDVLWTLRAAIKGASDGTATLPFQLWVSQVDGVGLKTELLALKAMCDTRDDGEPVITIMLREEH
jgi:hypothetical protein